MIYIYSKDNNCLTEKYIASLKSYPCIGDGWENGKEYEEGKDFEVVLKSIDDTGYNYRNNYAARLKQPVEDQKALWMEVEKINDNGTLFPSERMELYLKSFTITRKQ